MAEVLNFCAAWPFYSLLIAILGVFFTVANVSYGILLLFSWLQIQYRSRMRTRIVQKIQVLADNPHDVPSITLLIPAFNEAVIIVQSVKSFLDLDYGSYHVIVINDGSTDATLEILMHEFELEEIELKPTSAIGTGQIRSIFQSRTYPALMVIDQLNGGKAAALNTGIRYSSSDLVCCVDADTIPERDCLLRTVIPILENPHEIVASGGVLRVFNGCALKDGKVHQGDLPKSYLASMQVIEYIRSFFGGRIGWESIDATVLISGAFTLFNRYALVAGGGYREGDITEDFEVILRIRAALRNHGKSCRVAMIPDPVCWTQVPESWRDLRRQRLRWQKGGILTLYRYKNMMFRWKHGSVGMCVLPYILFFEIFSPVAELLAYFLVICGLLRGILDPVTVITAIGIGILYSTLVSMIAAYFEESMYARHHPKKRFGRFLMISIIENIGYRQVQAVFRFESLVRALLPNHEWGTITRRQFARSQPHPAQFGSTQKKPVKKAS